MAFEEFIRRTQLPQPGSAARNGQSVASKETGRTASGGAAKVKPKGYTPFNVAGTGLPTEEPGTDTGGLPTGGTPPEGSAGGGWPTLGDIPPDAGSGGTEGWGGGSPNWQDGGTTPSGGFVGAPPIGGHGTLLDIGGGAGAGTAETGRLYACGAQERGEFGLGIESAAIITPPAIVPGMPFVTAASFAARAAYVVTSGGGLVVAGEAIENAEPIGSGVADYQPLYLVAPEISRYTQSRVVVSSAASVIASVLAARVFSGSNADDFSIGANSRYAQPFRMTAPAVVAALQLKTRTSLSGDYISPALSKRAEAVIYRCSPQDFVAGNTGDAVARLYFAGDGVSKTIFTAASPFALTEGEYVADISWTGAATRVDAYTADFLGAAYVQSGGAWVLAATTRAAKAAALEIDLISSATGALSVRRIDTVQDEKFLTLAADREIVGMRLWLRGITSASAIGVAIMDGRHAPGSGYQGAIAKGYKRFGPEDVTSGMGPVDVIFSRPITPEMIPASGISGYSHTLSIDTFGGSYEIAMRTSFGEAQMLTEYGHRVRKSSDGVASMPLTAPAGAASSTPAYGANLGISTPDPVVASFVLSPISELQQNAEACGVSEWVILGNSNAAYATGSGPFGASERFTRLSGTGLQGGDTSGAALVTKSRNSYGVGPSLNGRLGFGGTATTLALSDAPRDVIRARFSPLHVVQQLSDGSLYGAGRGLSGGWNPTPELGVFSTANASQRSSFVPIWGPGIGMEAWDVGGSGTEAWTLISDGVGVRAAGKMPGCFTLSSWTLMAWDFTAKHIRCGRAHALIVTPDGDLYGIGDNSRGQLGIAESFAATPRFIAGGIAKAFADGDRSFIIAA